MLIPRVILAPHLPTLVLDEHRGHRTPMLEAFAETRRWVESRPPEVAVVLSARWCPTGPFRVGSARRHRTITDYPKLGVELRYDCPGHPALARGLIQAGERAGVHVGPMQRGIDSGVAVPLHFLLPRPKIPVVPLALATRPARECRAWGEVLRVALEKHPAQVLFVVGGMLSDAEHDWSLGREVPEARELDERVTQALAAGAWSDLGEIETRVRERAQPEAGLRHLELLRGFLGADVAGEMKSYEAGPGVGGALMEFAVAS